MRKIEGAALRKGLAGMRKEKGNGLNSKPKGKGTPLTKGGATSKKKKKDLEKISEDGRVNQVPNNAHKEDKFQPKSILGAREDSIACSKLLKDETDPYCPDFDEEPALLPPIGRKRKPLQNNGVKTELVLDQLFASLSQPENGDVKGIPHDIKDEGQNDTTGQILPVGSWHGPEAQGICAPQEGTPQVSGVTTPKKTKKKKVKVSPSPAGPGEEGKETPPKPKKRKKLATENTDGAPVENGALEENGIQEHSPPKKKKEKSDYKMDCATCEKTFRSEKIYTRHLKICGLDEDELERLHPHKCTECEYRSPKKAMVARHMESHGIFKCLKCDFVGDSKEAFKLHTQALHKDRADMRLCRICSRYVKCDVITLDKHMEECKGKVPLFCPECKKEFKYESSLSVHLNSHYPDRPKRFSCEQCDYKSNYKANLQKHISCMHENRVRSVKCTECDKLFYSEESMRRHAKLHTEERLYQCEVCGQDFKTQATLKGHKELHNPERPYVCSMNDCEKGFRSPKLLKKHQDEFHQMSPKRFHCRVEGCNLSFFKGSHLRRHETTHTGERNYKCDWEGCGKAFRHADNLKIHKRQHTNEKPVKCEFCDFSCRQKSSLQWHKNKHHPEVKDGIIAEDAAFWEAVMAVVMEPEQDENKDGGGLSTDVKTELLTDMKLGSPDSTKGNVKKTIKKSKKRKSASPMKQKDGEGTKAVEGTSVKALTKKKKKSVKKGANQGKPEESEQKEGAEGIDGTEESAATCKSTKGKKKKGLKLPKVKGKKKGLKKNKLKLDNKTMDTPDHAKEKDDAETPGKSPEKSPKKKGLKKKSKTKPAEEAPNGEENVDGEITKVSEEEPGNLTKTRKTKKQAKVVNSVSPKSKATGKRGRTKKSPEKPPKTSKKKSPKKKGTESPEKEADVINEGEEEGEEKDEAGQSPGKTKPIKKRKRGKADDLEEEDEPKAKKVRKSPTKSPPKSPVKSPVKSPAKSPAKKSEDKKVSPKAKKSPAKMRQKKLKTPPKGNQKKAAKGSPKGRPKKATTKSPPKPRQKKGKKPGTEALEEKPQEEEENVVPKVEDVEEKEDQGQSVTVPLENSEKLVEDDDNIAEDSDSDLWGNNEDNNNEEERDRNCDADDERELDNDDDMDKFSELDFRDESNVEKPVAASEEIPVQDDDAKSRTSEANNSLSDDAASLDDAIPDTPPRAPLRPNDNEEDVDENDYYEPPPSPPPPPPMDPVDQRSIERQDSEQTVMENSVPLSASACTPQEVGTEDTLGQDALEQPLSQEQNTTYVRTPQSQQPDPPPVSKDYFGHYLHDIPTVEDQAAPPTNHDPNSPNDVPEDLSNIALSAGSVDRGTVDINSTATPQDLRAEPVSTITHTRLQRETVSGIPNANIERETVSTITHTSRTIQPVVTQPPATIPIPGMQTDVMSYQRMELLACGRQAETYLQQKESSLQRLTSITYQNFGNLDPANPTSREMNYLRPSDNMFARSCAGGGFMRVSGEGDPSLGRAGMNSFLRQPDTTFARPETALTRASNPSLLRPGTVGEDLFARDAMGRPVSRSPFHGAWAGQEIRPAHWNQTPYLQRPVERASNSTTPALLGKDNYLPDRPDFTFDPSRTIPEQNMFSNLTSQQHELPRDSPFQLERFDLSSYFGSHPYTATPGLDYGHPTCGANQKAFEDRLRQPTSVPDLRGLPQPPSTDMLNQFCGINVNPSFNLDKYMYARDPVYRPQHVATAGESAFLSHAAPTQPTYFGRDYAGRTLYPQSTPYALMDERQYGPASKLTHPSGVQQERDLMARRTTSNDNQIQDPYRRSVIYNVMNRFYE